MNSPDYRVKGIQMDIFINLRSEHSPKTFALIIMN